MLHPQQHFFLVVPDCRALRMFFNKMHRGCGVCISGHGLCTHTQTVSTGWDPAHIYRQPQHHRLLPTYTDCLNIVGPGTHIQTTSMLWGLCTHTHTHMQHRHYGALHACTDSSKHCGGCRRGTGCCGWGSARRRTACCWHLLRARPCEYAPMTQRCAPSAAPPNPSG